MPRGTVHFFLNSGPETARIILTFTPAGIEHWFEETLDRAPNEVRAEDVPDNLEEVAARYDATAPRYGIEFVQDAHAREGADPTEAPSRAQEFVSPDESQRQGTSPQRPRSPRLDDDDSLSGAARSDEPGLVPA